MMNVCRKEENLAPKQNNNNKKKQKIFPVSVIREKNTHTGK